MLIQKIKLYLQFILVLDSEHSESFTMTCDFFSVYEQYFTRHFSPIKKHHNITFL